jgi:cyclopropane fatty-acyl-phospholipid synthase-like methyltransferase
MDISKEELGKMLKTDRFPLSNKYDAQWVAENSMGPNALWLTEWLCEDMDLKPGMRVLDMGCGRAMSSIFLAREHGVRVWANDLWIPATDNGQRIREAGVEDLVCPIHAEAHALPYAEGFFDALVSLDSYHYYGTDTCYLNYYAKFVKPGGQIGIVVPGLMREFEDGVPEHLARKQASGGVFWDPRECWSIRTLEWWKEHWTLTGIVDIELADTLEDGWKYWLQHDKAVVAASANVFPSDAECIEEDAGRYMGFVRVIARRR